MPTTTATAAAAAPASNSARLRSQCQSSSATAPTTAPTAAKDIWPRLTWPDQPVSTTTEHPTTASATSVDASTSAPGPSHRGNVHAAAKAAAVPSGMPALTSGSRRASTDRSRTLPARVSDASVSRSVRRTTSWRRRMAAKTTPARTASPSAGLVGSSHATPCCSTPSATAATAMARRSEKLPSASAANAVTRAVRP